MVHTKAQSPLKDNNSTGLDLNSINTENVDIVRQLLNQETIIRMTLVKNVHTLMKDMLSLQEKLAEAEVEISSLKKSTDSELTDLKNEVMLLKLENVNVNSSMDNLKSALRLSETEQLKLSAAVSSLELLRVNLTNHDHDKATKFAFTAGVTSSNKTWRSGVMVFDKVIFSIRSGYNPSTGVFTAPIEGNYVFYVSAVEFSNRYLGVFIDKNGKHQ
ncbi:uncharacterized protein LOC134249247, partial [Saccostrea cucullata]